LVYDFILTNYINKKSGEAKLFDATKSDLDLIFGKRYKGFSEQLRMVNMLNACIKRVSSFAKISKNKALEAELLLYILDIPFSMTPDMFGTCFTQYDTKVAMILKRLINIVTQGLHEDYMLEFQEKINNYLNILHHTSNHIDNVNKLPKSI
jgi:hypothetical protein